MSCYHVFMQDGRKMMRPILNSQQYLALRGTKSQHILTSACRNGEDDKKTLLLQENYSCLPNDDGTLKGSTRLSNTVGMDIDHIAPEDMQSVKERILSKKDELGLQMLEQSARGKGYHIVFKRRPELGQEENLQWAADLLGVEFDQAAKDITRVFFTTTDSPEDLVFLSEDLFINEECPQPPQKEESRHCATEPSLEVSQSEDSEEPSYRGIPYSAIIEKWWELNGGIPQQGERNVRLHQLAVHLRAITDNNKDLLLSIMPRLCLSKQEIGSIVDSACKEPPMGITGKMREVLEALEVSDWQAYNPPPMPKKPPRLLYLCLKPFPKAYWPMLAVCHDVYLSPHASHFRATYCDGRVIPPNLFGIFSASSGSNKSFVSTLMEMMTANTLQASDKAEWEKVRLSQEERDRLANAKEKPPKYKPKLRVAETVSTTSLLALQTNLGDNGMLLCNFPEADTFTKATKARFSDISDLLRKAWDGETVRQYYISDNTCSTCVRVNASVMVTGTPKAVLKRFFSDTENGLMQRFMPLLYPNMKRTFQPPRITPLCKEEEAERDALLQSLWHKDLALGDETQLLEMPKTQKVVTQWYEKLEDRYYDGELTEAEADLSHRIGQFMMRAAIPYVALYGEEQKEVLDYIQWLGDYIFYNVCYLFSSRVDQDLKESQKLLHHTDRRLTVEPILKKMPLVFTTEMFKQESPCDNVRSALSRQVKKGRLERLEPGLYRQIIPAE